MPRNNMSDNTNAVFKNPIRVEAGKKSAQKRGQESLSQAGYKGALARTHESRVAGGKKSAETRGYASLSAAGRKGGIKSRENRSSQQMFQNKNNKFSDEENE